MSKMKFLIVLIIYLSPEIAYSSKEIKYKTAQPLKENEYSMNDILKEQRLVLKPPSKLQSFLTSSSNIYLVWDAPEVYKIHDVDSNDTFWDDDNTTMSWLDLNETETTTVDNITSKPTGVTETDPGTTSESPFEKGYNSSVMSRNICRPYVFLYNRTRPGDYAGVVKKPGSLATHAMSIEDNDKNEDSVNMTEVTINISEAVAPFSQGCVEQYTIYVYNDKTGELAQSKRLGGNEPTEINIKELEPSTTYKLLVGAEFTSRHKLNSTSITVTTKADTDTKDCQCNGVGTIGGHQPCRKDNTSLCICKPGYSGLFCEVCQSGFYKTAMFFPCHPCPCQQYSSVVSSCHFLEGFLVCDQCRKGYTGNLCHQCANSFYRYKGKYCVPCRCHANTDPNAKSVCDPYSGACVSCIRNTTGFNCERCREGYSGDAIIYKNCTAISDLENGLLPLPAGYIAGIVIAVILILSFILGFVVYKWWKYPAMKPFWTVELKEDHEGVSFSAVDDQEFMKATETRNKEGQFYEKQGRGMKYAQLREDI